MAARIDFFISYTGRDLPWAEWVDARLREAGYSMIVQFADFRPGQNIIHRMQTALATANQVIGILSPRYLESPFTTAEWTAAVRDDPLGEKRRLLLVRVEPTELIGLLPNIIHIDLVGLSEEEAAERLLGGIKASVPRTATHPSGSSISPQFAAFPPCLPRTWHVPLRRKPFFTGRSELIAGIRSHFDGPSQTALTLSGIGGGGKTRIAIEYCYDSIREYAAIWWIDASEERLIRESLTRLGESLGSIRDGDDMVGEEVTEAVQSGLHGVHRWLLVFDDAPGPGSVTPWIPRLPHGHVLMTSRNPAWRETGPTLEILPLEREHAITFLLSRSGDTDRAAAHRLAEGLGYLPLALEQAAAFVERSGCGLGVYERRFRERRVRYERFEDESERAMTAIWDISIRRMFVEDPVAAILARMLSFFGPYRIPLFFIDVDEPRNVPLPSRVVLGAGRRLLRRVYDETRDIPLQSPVRTYTFRNALESLKKYALVELNEAETSFHPLVRAVIQSRVRRYFHRTMTRNCARMLFASMEDAYSINETKKLWVLHALDIARRAEQLGLANHYLVQITLRAAEIATASAARNQFEGIDIIRQALRFANALPRKEQAEWQLGSLLRLAPACVEADCFGEGATHLREAIDLLLSIGRPSTETIVWALSEYAGLLMADWESSKAGKFYEAALAIERSRSSQSLPLAAVLSDYAMLLRSAGEYDQAESVATDALAMAVALSGATHPIVGVGPMPPVMPVHILGRGSGLVLGTVSEVAEDRIDIYTSQGTVFSDQGDAGALVLNAAHELIGLVWGGKRQEAFAVPIWRVFSELKVHLVE